MLLRVRVDSSPAHLVNKKTEFVVAAPMDGVGRVAHAHGEDEKVIIRGGLPPGVELEHIY